MMVLVSPGSPSQWIATRPPWPAATWRSRQLCDTFSVPPDEPPGEGQVPLENGVPLVEPVEGPGLLGPERLDVARGALERSTRSGHDGLLGEALGGGNRRSSR